MTFFIKLFAYLTELSLKMSKGNLITVQSPQLSLNIAPMLSRCPVSLSPPHPKFPSLANSGLLSDPFLSFFQWMFPPSCSTLFFPCKSISLPWPFSGPSLTPHRKPRICEERRNCPVGWGTLSIKYSSFTLQVSDPRPRAGMSSTQSHPALEEQNQSSRSLIPKLGLFPKARAGLRRLWWMRKSSVIFRDSHILSKYWCCMCFRAQDSHSPSPRKRPGVCVPRESTAPSSVLVLRGLYLHIPGGSHTFSVKGAPWNCGGLARAAQFLYVPQWLSGGLEGKD